MELRIEGDKNFVAWTNKALDLLRERSLPNYEFVLTYLDAIHSVPNGTRVAVQEHTAFVGDSVAWAPSLTKLEQLSWYASHLAHEAQHVWLWSRGLPHLGKDAEVWCLITQRAALVDMIGPGTMVDMFEYRIAWNLDEEEYWKVPSEERSW